MSHLKDLRNLVFTLHIRVIAENRRKFCVNYGRSGGQFIMTLPESLDKKERDICKAGDSP
jgi:flagellar motor switch protein FliM